MKKFSQVRILFSLAVPSFAGLCLSFNGFAVVLIPGDIETVIAASKTQPDKLYILEVGGEWCPFCTQEQKWLKESPGPEAKKAVWYHLEANEENFSRFREQALAHGIRFSTAVPYNIVFKNGLPVASAYGFKAAELEAFLSEAAIVQPSELWALSANISSYDTHFLCGPVAGEESDECVFGLLGEFPESEPTDDFGRGNLRAFSELFEDPAYRQLIATPTFESVPIQATLNRIINPQLEYDFYVPNPMSLFDAQLIDPLAEGYDFQSWIDAPGESARLMLTGHGRRDGIPLKVYANGKSQEELLTPDQFKEISAQIRSSGPGSPNGKTLRAIVTTCFGGKFGSGFMPMPGVKQQACAAFSSLPNKYAEGCYQNDFLTEKRDYLATAARFKKCDGSQDARQLHYNVVLNSEGFDIPMLSSDYFLQYGPGFDYFRKKYGVNFWSDVQDLITDHLIHDTFKSAHNVRDLVKRIQDNVEKAASQT